MRAIGLLVAVFTLVGCGGSDGGDGTKKAKFDVGKSARLTESGLQKAKMGDLDGAIAELTQAIEANGGNVVALRNRGIARRDKGDYAGALPDLELAVNLAPEDAMALANRCIVHMMLGKDAEYRADYDHFVKTWPSFKPGLDADLAKFRAKRG